MQIFKTEMSGSGSDLEKIMDPDPVCPERLDLVNNRLDPKPWLRDLKVW